MITIVNYGVGNLGSMLNMLKRIGTNASIENDVTGIKKAKKIILPGVGSFDNAMSRINNIDGLRQILTKKALEEKVPILGVCLGMQLLTRSSEEGELAGLGWIPGCTKRIPFVGNHKIPHMGWNLVLSKTKNKLTEGLESKTRFYFTHSYYVELDDDKNSIMKTNHGIEFNSVIAMENIFGVQFHPEKSHKYGMRLLENFARIKAC